MGQWVCKAIAMFTVFPQHYTPQNPPSGKTQMPSEVLRPKMLTLALFIVATNLQTTKIPNDSEVVTQI